MKQLSKSAILLDFFCSSRIPPQERLRDESKGRLHWGIGRPAGSTRTSSKVKMDFLLILTVTTLGTVLLNIVLAASIAENETFALQSVLAN